MVKNLPTNAGDEGLIPGSGRSPGVGNGNLLLQYSCLENSRDRGAWQAIVHRVAKSQTQSKQIGMQHALIPSSLLHTFEKNLLIILLYINKTFLIKSY